MQRITSLLAVIFFLGCVALGYLLLQQHTEVARLNLDWKTSEKEAQGRIGDLQHKLAAASAAQAAAAKAAAAAARAPSANRNANGDPGVIHIGQVLKDHPEYGPLYAKQVRRQINSMYGNTLSTLNLSPDQVGQLKNLLAEKQMSNIDAQGAAEAAGLQRGTAEWQDAMKQAAQNVEQQITGLLGPNADNLLAQAQVRNGYQNMVAFNYSPDFSDANAPLTADQSTGLVAALSDANYSGKDMSARPSNYNDPDPTTGLSPHDDRILSNAAQVLTPAQLQVLKSDQIATEAQMIALKEYNPNGGPVRLAP
jgi:hypothetical protein